VRFSEIKWQTANDKASGGRESSNGLKHLDSCRHGDDEFTLKLPPIGAWELAGEH